MKCRISQHMDWGMRDPSENCSPMELASRIIWTWKMEVWGDDQDPPWKGDEAWDACSRDEIPITWIPNAGETIPVGYT